jgi:hypothetical protein
MPPSALRSASRKNGPRRVGAKGKRFVGESALQKYARLQRQRRNATAMSRRRGPQASSSTAAKSRKSRSRKVRVAANASNMNIEALLRRSTRSRKPVERFDPSELAGASAKARSAPKSRNSHKSKKAHKVVPLKFHAATVAVPNWGGESAGSSSSSSHFLDRPIEKIIENSKELQAINEENDREEKEEEDDDAMRNLEDMFKKQTRV